MGSLWEAKWLSLGVFKTSWGQVVGGSERGGVLVRTAPRKAMSSLTGHSGWLVRLQHWALEYRPDLECREVTKKIYLVL